MDILPQNKRACRTEMRRNFFSQRIVNLQNSPAQRALEAQPLSIFKAEVDGFPDTNDMGTMWEDGAKVDQLRATS